MRILIFCGICFTFASALLAQTTAPSDATGSDDDQRQFQIMKQTFEQAVRENRIEMMAPFLDPQFSIVTYTDREFTDFEAFKAQWQKTRDQVLQGGSYTVELLPDRRIVSGDISISKGNSENVLTTGGGNTQQFESHWTVICRKTDGQWKILRAHNSLNPFSNPMLESAVRKMILKYCALAGIVGLFVGFILHMLIRRRGRERKAAA